MALFANTQLHKRSAPNRPLIWFPRQKKGGGGEERGTPLFDFRKDKPQLIKSTKLQKPITCIYALREGRFQSPSRREMAKLRASKIDPASLGKGTSVISQREKKVRLWPEKEGREQLSSL